LPAAVALNSMGFNMARTLGPAVGGVIVAAAGSSMAFLINAVTYVGPIVTFARLRGSRGEDRDLREPLISAVGMGVRYARESPALLAVLARAAAHGLAG